MDQAINNVFGGGECEISLMYHAITKQQLLKQQDINIQHKQVTRVGVQDAGTLKR